MVGGNTALGDAFAGQERCGVVGLDLGADDVPDVLLPAAGVVAAVVGVHYPGC